MERKQNHNNHTFIFSSFFFLLFISTLTCKGEVIKWIGGKFGNWDNHQNWSLNRLPNPFDDVLIVGFEANNTVILDLLFPSPVVISSLTLENATLEAHNPLVLQSPSTVLKTGKMFVFSNLHGEGTLTIFGQLHLCGSLVNITEVDIQNVGELYLNWVQNRERVPLSETESQPFFYDYYYGIALATEEISIVVPSTRGNVVLDDVAHEFYVDTIAKRISMLAGGCTSFSAHGYWISHTQTLIKEKVSVLTAFVEITPNIKEELQRIALWLVRELQQEAVLIRFNKQSYLVYSLRNSDSNTNSIV